jgi:uncharacterized membrane protein
LKKVFAQVEPYKQEVLQISISTMVVEKLRAALRPEYYEAPS